MALALWPLLVVPLSAALALLYIHSWRRPVHGLAVLVAGIAFHNTGVLALLYVDTPEPIIRVLQLWKEALIVLLLLKVGEALVVEARAGTVRSRFHDWRGTNLGVRIIDVTIVGFSLLLMVYAVLPPGVVAVESVSITQRLLGFRMLAIIPALYVIGRWLATRSPGGLSAVAQLAVLTAVAVTLGGLVELWFIPTSQWVALGVPHFIGLQGFADGGPGGLPSNFFQSTTAGLALRRMVSTYLSPLGIAYTGLLVVPMISAGLLSDGPRRRTMLWIALTLVVASIALSVTRLAVLCLVGESVLLTIMFRRRAAVAAAGVAVAGMFVALIIYPLIGPLVTYALEDVRPPAGQVALQVVLGAQASPLPSPTSTPGPTTTVPGPDADILNRLVTGDDGSIQGHIEWIRIGLEFATKHPLGVGLGASTYRFGTGIGPGESAFLGIAGELGWVGLLLNLLAYCGVIVVSLLAALRTREWPDLAFLLACGIGGIGLLPIAATSAVWGDFSVTYLFWAAAGISMTLAARRVTARTGHLPRQLANSVG
jgi:hypothetical protein